MLVWCWLCGEKGALNLKPCCPAQKKKKKTGTFPSPKPELMCLEPSGAQTRIEHLPSCLLSEKPAAGCRKFHDQVDFEIMTNQDATSHLAFKTRFNRERPQHCVSPEKLIKQKKAAASCGYISQLGSWQKSVTWGFMSVVPLLSRPSSNPAERTRPLDRCKPKHIRLAAGAESVTSES